MPTPAVSLKLKKFRRRFGITAPRVAVRPHLGWHWYAGGVLAGVVVVAALVWSVAQRGETAGLRRELDETQRLLLTAEEELLRLRSASGTEQNVVQMERSTQQQLASRLRVLESENAWLKEEIALFERLVPPADGGESMVRIERLRVVPEGGGGQYRYRILLGFQGGKQNKDFKGRLQLRINYVLGGREQTFVEPPQNRALPDFDVEVRHFLRKEGTFAIPAGAQLRGVEAFIWQGDTLKAKGSAQL